MSNINPSTLTSAERKLIEIDANYQSNISDGNISSLSRSECFDIYRNWSFGKRIIEALPTYSMAVPRKISFKNAPDDVAEHFIKVADEMEQDKIIKRCLIYTRITGIGGLFVASKGNIPASKNLDVSEIQEFGITFNAIDSLALTNNTYNQDPLSPLFMKPMINSVLGVKVGNKRIFTITNGEPIYLKFNNSSFNFSGASTFQNLIPFMKSHIMSSIAMRRVSGKAGAIIYGNERGGNRATGEQIAGIEASKNIINNLDNFGTASISNRDTVNFFPLQAISELESLLKAIEYEIMIGVADTPKTLLLDESLVNGMAEGTNDFSLALLVVESFRKHMLTPLYKFTDPYIMKVAFTDEFVKRVTTREDRYNGLTPQEIRDIWAANFTYEYENLIKEPDSIVQEREAKALEKLQRAKELGASSEFIESELNKSEIFNSEVSIEETDKELNNFTEPNQSVGSVNVKKPSLRITA